MRYKKELIKQTIQAKLCDVLYMSSTYELYTPPILHNK